MDERSRCGFAIIGDTPPDFAEDHRAACVALAQQLGVADQVRFLGFRSDVRPYLGDADVVVVPSVYADPLPRAVIEGMALGKPIVAFGVGGIGEMLDDDVEGTLVSGTPPDVAGLAAAMLRAFREPERRRQQGAAARARVLRDFDGRRHAARIESTDPGSRCADSRPRRRRAETARMNAPVLCVTIDCERDKGPRWRVRRPAAFSGVHEGIGARLDPLFRHFGVKATYLLSPEVMRDDAAATRMAQVARGGAELGTHLHAEYIGPSVDEEAESTTIFQAALPPALERAKIAALTSLYVNTFGGRAALVPRRPFRHRRSLARHPRRSRLHRRFQRHAVRRLDRRRPGCARLPRRARSGPIAPVTARCGRFRSPSARASGTACRSRADSSSVACARAGCGRPGARRAP